MEYKTEEEFLKNYDSNCFEKLSMTADILLLSVSDEEQDNYRKATNKKMSILLIKRDTFPFKDKWCLPGGFLNPLKETLEECAIRVLFNETNLKDIYLEQLYTFDSLNRDPRMRVVSSSFIALVDKNKLTNKVNKKASWFDIDIKENNNIFTVTLNNGNDIIEYKVKKELKNKTTSNYEYEVIENNYVAFDHCIVISSGIDRLKNKIEYTDIVFNMMPEYFTLGELQRVYETILGKKLLDPAFRRIISCKVEKTDKLKTGKGHRPSVMFKYKS
jgi:ADP-ribose pyrophosphatase YjhB (NUDIX family)